ncbi:MAG TPA: HipA domain-containing protein [Solirubrobacterales bacterium]|nr:HipA domain-containing protein [Solirubrobacterales bacterium]
MVSRFDRVIGSDGLGSDGLRRVHQEDLCQALGVDPGLQRGRAKYERAGAAEYMFSSSAAPAEELDRLVAIMAFTVLIGNADAHGKNLALLHRGPETISLAPLYDTVPTLLWPKLRAELAMSVAGVSSLDRVTLADVVREASTWPHRPERARAVAIETAEQLEAAIQAETIPSDSAVAQLVRERLSRMRR